MVSPVKSVSQGKPEHKENPTVIAPPIIKRKYMDHSSVISSSPSPYHTLNCETITKVAVVMGVLLSSIAILVDQVFKKTNPNLVSDQPEKDRSQKMQEEIQLKHQAIEEKAQRKIQEMQEKLNHELHESQEKLKCELSQSQKVQEEIQLRYQAIEEKAQRKIQELEENLKRELQADKEASIEWKKEVERKAEQAGEEAYEEWMKQFFGSQSQPVLETNCPALDAASFKEMSDIERLIDPRLNPLCCDHAEILFTLKSDGDTPAFSSLDKISSQWRKLASMVHPDKNPDLIAQATLAFQKAIAAKEVLQLCLPRA